jgi:hypothetical protein
MDDLKTHLLKKKKVKTKIVNPTVSDKAIKVISKAKL